MRFDLDDILSYTTVKTVKIRDRYLGILHYAAMVAIFLYIIVFTVLLDRGYLYFESPVGNTRFSMRRPYLNGDPNPTPPEELDYCLTPANPNVSVATTKKDKCVDTNGNDRTGQVIYYENYPCLYFDEDDAVFPTAELNAIMLTTRVTSQVYTLNDSCSLLDYKCGYIGVGSESINYIADVEYFTLLIDHAMRAPISGKQRNGKFIKGKLLNYKGDTYPKKWLNPDIERIAHEVSPGVYEPTILRMDTILNASGILNLNRPSDSTPLCAESYRYTGLVLVMFARYTNRFSFNENNIRYTLQFQPLAETEFKTNQEIFLNPFVNMTSGEYDLGTSLVRNRHGIRIVAVILGEIGHFEFQTLLLTLVSGLGLMTMSTIIVDFIATSLLPNKLVYDAYKTQHSVDFSDWRAGKATLSPDVQYEMDQRKKKKEETEGNDGGL